MIRKILFPLLLTGGLNYSQQQIDIPWPTLANSPWPMIAHDPQLTGRSPYIGPKTPTIKWTMDLPYGVFSGPVIGEDRTLYVGAYAYLGFAGDTSNYFYAINPNGEIKWTFITETPYSNASGYLINNEGTIFFGSASGWLYAIDSIGNLKWKYDTGGFITQKAMNIDLKGNIYIVNYIVNNEKNLISISKNGELNWKKSYGGGFPLRSATISPDGNTIYIVAEDRNLYRLNLDGSIQDTLGCVGNAYQPLMIDNSGNVYVVTCEHPMNLISMNSDGNIRWEYEINDSALLYFDYASPAIDYSGNIYYSYSVLIDGNYYGRIESLDYYGIFRWTYQFTEMDEIIGMPLVVDKDGTVYCGSIWGYYYYAISSEGKLLWKIPLNGYQVDNSTAIGSDGTLYIGTHKSSTHITGEKTLIAIQDTGSVSVNELANEIKDFSLSQNYPNPFNPNTSIQYTIGSMQFVTLKAYDLLGREVANLVNEVKPAGTYEVEFSINGVSLSSGNASSLPSGVYIYVLRVNNFSSAKKMILLK